MQTSAVPNMAVSSPPPNPPYTLHPTTPLTEVPTAAYTQPPKAVALVSLVERPPPRLPRQNPWSRPARNKNELCGGVDPGGGGCNK